MAESNKIMRVKRIKFVASVNIEGEYTIKQVVPFRDRLYLLIERPDTTPELYYVNEETRECDLVQFEGLEPLRSKLKENC